ncbi:MAG: DNA damage-inducible protein D [Bacteroidales bacterium]|nr:DNA damage-inducible protein D [Bacteroidales bacterium]
MGNELTKEVASLFESLKHINEDGVEYWSARELYPHLGYARWQRFEETVEKAKEACKSASQRVEDHFTDVGKIVKAGVSTKTKADVHMTRYACYLVAQNGDPRKREIAQAQTYFAIQTRYAEIQQMEAYQTLTSEDSKRLFLREELRKHNSKLADAAHNAGVITPLDYAVFQNFGYRGLYNGLTAKGIQEKKGLKKGQDILNHMGSTELAANLFRATQTEEKIRKENIKGKANANNAHFEVGKEVRAAIQRIGGTMPEELPPAEDIKKLERRVASEVKNTEKPGTKLPSKK